MKRLILLVFMALLQLPALCQEQQARPPRVPESVEFAGQTVAFDRDDLYERMDRELMTFTYMHTTSSLMLKRSRRYFEQVVPILKANGIPEG